MNDFAGEHERPSEQTRGVCDISLGDSLANERAGNHFSPVNHRRKHHDFESVRGAEFPEQPDIAGLLVPEAKIFADKNGANAQVANQDLLNELLGREARQLESEWQNDRRLETQIAERVDALCNSGELQRRTFRAEDTSRRRIERQSSRHGVEGTRTFGGASQHGLMPEMNAVEAANGKHAVVVKFGKPRGPRLGRG